jgi:hypothetical protein
MKRVFAFFAVLIIVAFSCATAHADLSVWAIVEGSTPTDLHQDISSVSASSSNAAGTGDAYVNAVAGTISVSAGTFSDGDSVGASAGLGNRDNPGFDVYTIHGLRSGAGEVTLPVTLHVTGSVYVLNATKYADLHAALDFSSTSNSGSSNNRRGWIVNNYYTQPQQSRRININEYIIQNILVSEVNPTFSLRYWLSAGARHSGSEAIGNAALSFDLPQGTWLTSESGYSQSSVPLPGALWLFAPALAGIVGLRRRLSK